MKRGQSDAGGRQSYSKVLQEQQLKAGPSPRPGNLLRESAEMANGTADRDSGNAVPATAMAGWGRPAAGVPPRSCRLPRLPLSCRKGNR